MSILGLVILGASIGPTICLDPGHPSESGRGTRGRHTTEIAVAWRIAKLLETRLEADGYNVVLTKRSSSQFVTNRRRAEIANVAHADLFLRLHCDASSETGFGVYYPDRPGIAPDGHKGPSEEALRRTKPVAESFHAALAQALAGKLHDHGLMGDDKTAIGSRQGALTGSIYSDVPTVLVEMVVLTNASDEAFIRSKQGTAAMVSALAAAVQAAIPSGSRPT